MKTDLRDESLISPRLISIEKYRIEKCRQVTLKHVLNGGAMARIIQAVQAGMGATRQIGCAIFSFICVPGGNRLYASQRRRPSLKRTVTNPNSHACAPGLDSLTSDLMATRSAPAQGRWAIRFDRRKHDDRNSEIF
jgi:hypothetical protein